MDNLIGKPVNTEHGEAIIKRYFPSLKCWHVTYPDNSIGWVNQSQFTLID
jgi:hypothetical protein